MVPEEAVRRRAKPRNARMRPEPSRYYKTACNGLKVGQSVTLVVRPPLGCDIARKAGRFPNEFPVQLFGGFVRA